MDNNDILVAYDLFPGNESEKRHMLPVIRRMQRDMTDSRIILVADCGLNTSDNIYYLHGGNKEDHNTHNGYVYGMSVRGADAEFKEWALSEEGYSMDTVTDADGNECSFRHKSRIYPELLHVNETSVDGTIIKRKIEEKAKYDGYYSVVTSELNMPDLEMRRVYRGLNKMEQAFKISKSDFNTRPVFVRTNEHVESHFETCFTALVLIRLLQVKLDNRFPAGKILNALRKYSCVPVDSNIYQFVYFDEVLQACEKAFGISLNNKYLTRFQIRRMLKY